MKIELVEGGKAPERMSSGAAGYDVYARKVELHYEQVEPFDSLDDKELVGATINLGFKVDCNEIHDALYSDQETHDGGYIANWTAPMNFAALLLPRSGWGAKYGFRLLNTVGVIDPDYRGEVIMKASFNECPPELLEYTESECNGCGNANNAIKCESCNEFVQCRRVSQPRPGQMLITPCYIGELTQVEQLDNTERGDGGFGSTGHK